MAILNGNSSKRIIATRNRVRKFRARKKLLNERRSLINERLQQNTRHESNNETIADESHQNSLVNDLTSWSKQHNISCDAVTHLLKILICYGLKWLPADYRSLLQTPRNVEIYACGNGKCWYNGIEKQLRHIFSTLSRDIAISMKFNVDGIPLFKSSKLQFWPILASIYGNYFDIV